MLALRTATRYLSPVLMPRCFTASLWWLLIFADNILQLVHQCVREGAVYQVAPFNGMLVSAVNNEVEIHSWAEEEAELKFVCNYSNNILALFVKTKGDFILVSKVNV